jgi:hypothetical protein
VLHSFSGSDGALPFAGLIPDASGALYGTTTGGNSTAGTVFQLTSRATFTGVRGKANCTGQSISYMARKNMAASPTPPNPWAMPAWLLSRTPFWLIAAAPEPTRYRER